MPDDMRSPASETGGSVRGTGTPLMRVVEGVAVNVITASVLWMFARAGGYVSGNPVLTAAAVGVLTAAVVVLVVRLVLRNAPSAGPIFRTEGSPRKPAAPRATGPANWCGQPAFMVKARR